MSRHSVPFPNLGQYVSALAEPSTLKRMNLPVGEIARSATQAPLVWSGAHAAVFRYETVDINGRTSRAALRFFLRDAADRRRHHDEVRRYLEHRRLPFFVPFDYIEKGVTIGRETYPALKMHWAEGVTLKRHIENNIENREALEALAEAWRDLCRELERAEVVHGDLQDKNVIVTDPDRPSLKLIDYDTVCVPSLVGTPLLLEGVPSYQHPNRSQVREKRPGLDAFSTLSIYVSLRALAVLPSLWDDREIADTDSLVFNDEDYRNPDASSAFRALRDYGGEIAWLAEALAAMCRVDDPLRLVSLDAILAQRGTGSVSVERLGVPSFLKPPQPHPPRPLMANPWFIAAMLVLVILILVFAVAA